MNCNFAGNLIALPTLLMSSHLVDCNAAFQQGITRGRDPNKKTHGAPMEWRPRAPQARKFA